MRSLIIFILCQNVLLFSNLVAKNIFSDPIIIDSLYWATSVSAADIDHDGDFDLLATAYKDQRGVVWYENLDGKGHFSESRLIMKGLTSDASAFMEVSAHDIDNDGDLDVVSSNEIGFNRVIWFENLDGKGSFGDFHSIVGRVGNAGDFYAVDIDNDGDIDILPALRSYNKVVWYENENGQGDFGVEKVISNSVKNVQDIFTADLDADGDQDVISASKDDNIIAWYQNIDGKGSFGPQNIISDCLLGPTSIYADDIDNDDDIDLVVGSFNDDKISWLENNDGKGTFSKPTILSDTADAALSVFTADLDLDGDVDILSASIFDNKICWYENISFGTFSEQKIINKNAVLATSGHAADLDGDGDIDVLSTSEGDQKVVWYKNLTTTTSVEKQVNNILNYFELHQNYPNPFNPSTLIKYSLNRSCKVIITIYNLAGQEIETLVNEWKISGQHEVVWQPKNLQSGIYFVQLKIGSNTKNSLQKSLNTKRLIYLK